MIKQAELSNLRSQGWNKRKIKELLHQEETDTVSSQTDHAVDNYKLKETGETL